MTAWLIKWYLGSENMDKIKAVVSAVTSFGEGHRTQIAGILLALVRGLQIVNVLTPAQVGNIESVLIPLAGAAFAAKISRIGNVVGSVVGPTDAAKPT